MIANPAKCPLCRQHWLFDTNYLGELIARHPPGKCEPISGAVYEKEDEEDDQDFIERICDECQKRFKPKKSAKSQTICSSDCRQARRTRKHLEHGTRGKDWKLKLLKSLNLPTRHCVECNRLFTISGPHSRKQLLCSRQCLRVRKARKDKERKVA